MYEGSSAVVQRNVYHKRYYDLWEVRGRFYIFLWSDLSKEIQNSVGRIGKEVCCIVECILRWERNQTKKSASELLKGILQKHDWNLLLSSQFYKRFIAHSSLKSNIFSSIKVVGFKTHPEVHFSVLVFSMFCCWWWACLSFTCLDFKYYILSAFANININILSLCGKAYNVTS